MKENKKKTVFKSNKDADDFMIPISSWLSKQLDKEAELEQFWNDEYN